MTHEASVKTVAFSPDGRYALSGSWDGMARVWLWRPQDLIEEACHRLPRNLTFDEWQKYVGPEIHYHQTCPDKPVSDDVLRQRLQRQQDQQTRLLYLGEAMLLLMSRLTSHNHITGNQRYALSFAI